MKKTSLDSVGDIPSITTAYENKLSSEQCLCYNRKESNEYHLHNSNKYYSHNGPTFLVTLVLCDTPLAYKYILFQIYQRDNNHRLD